MFDERWSIHGSTNLNCRSAGSDNKLSGSYTASAGGSGLLSGTLSGGSAISLGVSTGGVATGTLSGDSISGTYGAKPGENTGTWTGTKGACAK